MWESECLGLKYCLLLEIMKKGSILHKDIKTFNIYVPNKAPKYMKQKRTEMKGGVNSTITVGSFNTQLSIMDRN